MPRMFCECGRPLNGQHRNDGCLECQKALSAVAHHDENLPGINPWADFYVCHAPGISSNRHKGNYRTADCDESPVYSMPRTAGYGLTGRGSGTL